MDCWGRCCKGGAPKTKWRPKRGAAIRRPEIKTRGGNTGIKNTLFSQHWCSAYGGVAGVARADEEAEIFHPLFINADVDVHQRARGVPARFRYGRRRSKVPTSDGRHVVRSAVRSPSPARTE